MAANGTVEIRPVTLGQTSAQGVVIEKGIAAGETVVTDGHLMLGPGVPVNIVSTVGKP